MSSCSVRASASLREIKFSSTVEPKLPDVPEFQIQFIQAKSNLDKAYDKAYDKEGGSPPSPTLREITPSCVPGAAGLPPRGCLPKPVAIYGDLCYNEWRSSSMNP